MLNMKRVIKWIKECRKDRIIVARLGEHLIMTDGFCAIRVPEASAWELVQHLPSKLPDGQGSWVFSKGSVSDGPDVLRVLSSVVSAATNIASTSGLILETQDYGDCRVFASNEGYVFVRRTHTDLFEHLDVVRAYKPHHPIVVYSGETNGEWVGAIISSSSTTHHYLRPISQLQGFEATA